MLRRFLVLTASLSLLSYISCSLIGHGTSSHSHAVQFQRRQANSTYPASMKTPANSTLKADWVQALNDAIAAGKIPDIPVSVELPNGDVRYPPGIAKSNKTCSWTVEKCNGPDDITHAPNSTWTIAFDDGPTASSSELYNFLKKNNQRGTHFMIGSQILLLPEIFKEALAADQEAAVHTWSHSLLTTKDNMGVLGELGWNMQIIYDLSGRVPKLFRPPQGDVDDRVRAIAKEVFGLTTVMWTADCNDWCLEASGGSTCPGEVPGEDRASVKSAIDAALKRPKSPGVSILEHELNHVTIELFTQYYPTLNASGWKPQAVSDQFGLNWYANAVDNDDIPINVTSMVAATTLAEVQQNNQSSTNATLYGNNNNNNNNTNTSNMSGLASNNTNPPTSPNSSSSSLQWTHPPVFTLALLVVVALVCT